MSHSIGSEQLLTALALLRLVIFILLRTVIPRFELLELPELHANIRR